MNVRMGCLLLAASACRIEPRGVRAPGPFHDGDPAVLGLEPVCDREAARWRLAAETDAWTSGGALFITRDGSEVERHTVYSGRAAANGSWDCLDLSLGQEASRVDVQPGSSTRWFCRDAEALSFLFVVRDTADEAWTDCRAWGADPGLWAEVDDVPACDQLVTIDEEGIVEPGFDACD